MRIERDVEGNMQIRGLTLICADTLHRLPEYLESDDPAVRARLLPQAYEDEEDEEQWRKYGASELEHLFLSRVEIVRKDLAGMQAEGRGPSVSIGRDGDDEARIVHATYRLSIPARHKAAWLSALNGGSHSIFIRHGLAPEDMSREPGTLGDEEKDTALLRVHVLGFLVHLLLEADGYRYDPELTEEDPL